MTNSVSSTGSAGSGQGHGVQAPPPPAPAALRNVERDVSGQSDVTERHGQRAAGGSTHSVFAETQRRAAVPGGAQSAPASMPGGDPSEPVIGRDIPRELDVPRLPEGAPLPPPLGARFDRPSGAGMGSGQSVGTTVSAMTDHGTRAADASVASLPDSQTYSEVDEIDIESQLVRPVSKEPLGATAFGAKIARANLIDAVKTHALMQPLAQLDPAANESFRQTYDNLVQAIDNTLLATRTETAEDGSTRHVDIESGRDLTHLAKFKEALSSGFEAVKKDLAELTESRDAFMNFKARQSTGNATASDKIQRNIFGSEMHAVFARSALQSVLVVGASAGLQVATVSILQKFFTNNPDQIPAPVLEAARAELGEGASRDDLIKHAVDGLASPGSTYLDENTSSDSAIYAAEAGVGAFRGVVVPMADSINESDARAAKVQSSIENMDQPPVAKNWKERGSEAMKSAWGAQIKANLISGGIAATISTAATKQTTGLNVLIEVGKTMGFSVIAAANNAAADGFRKAVYTGKSEVATQSIKAAARVVGRTIAQGIKTGASYAQSAADGSLASRSVGGDMLKAGMQSVVSGGVKEILGSVFQNATAARLPPNELAVLTASKALGSVAEFSRNLSSVERPADLSAEGQAKLQDLGEMVSNTLANVLSANSIKFESVDFDAGYQVYQSQLLQKIGEARAATSTEVRA